MDEASGSKRARLLLPFKIEDWVLQGPSIVVAIQQESASLEASPRPAKKIRQSVPMARFMRSLQREHGIEFPERRVPLRLAEIAFNKFDLRRKQTELLARQVVHCPREIERNIL